MAVLDNLRNWKSRLIVTKGNETYALKTDDIVLIYRMKLVIVVVDRNEQRYFYDKSLSELEALMDPGLFFRVNRQFIVNINYIKSFKVVEKVKLSVQLSLPNEKPEVIVSQETAPEFKRWLQGEVPFNRLSNTKSFHT
jgi:DNA-binding LytR/AlgR family response regulator